MYMLFSRWNARLFCCWKALFYTAAGRLDDYQPLRAGKTHFHDEKSDFS
jgi:hypothetical protein